MIAHLAAAVMGGTIAQGSLLDDMSHKAVQFFWDQSHPSTGLTKDRASNIAQTDNYTVASTASTGFAMTALAVGTQRGWLQRDAALTRARLTALTLLTRVQRNHGWFLHWIDWHTGDRMWNSEISSIDSAILFSGLIVAREYFNDPYLTRQVNRIFESVDWNWMLTNGGAMPNSQTFCMGWTQENGWIAARWNSYNEQLMLLIQAYGFWKACPSGVWSAVERPIHTYSGIQLIGGGPLFLHQMSHGFVDFNARRDRLGFDYWVASRRAALGNRQYCINNPNHFTAYGPNFWGLTASDGPSGYFGYGAPIWGDDQGTIAPTCVAAAMPFTPEFSLPALENIKNLYPASYRRYGFSNALNPSQNWIDPDVIGIDLGMAMCGIENYRDNFVHKYFMSADEIKEGMKRVGLQHEGTSSRLSDTLHR